MGLEEYTTEELRAELRKRAAAESARRAEERASAPICRNCVHCRKDKRFSDTYYCNVRTYTRRGRDYNYMVRLSNRCDQFGRREAL